MSDEWQTCYLYLLPINLQVSSVEPYKKKIAVMIRKFELCYFTIE